MEKEYKYKVATRCLTYNHAMFIQDALDGFIMQETSFPILFLVIDDASTDGEQDLLRIWAETNLTAGDGSLMWQKMPYGELAEGTLRDKPNISFAVLLLAENHHKLGKSKLPYIADWLNVSKYYAICEGDDYWVSSDKLQRQVSFLESHPEYVMTCSRAGLYSEKKKKIVGENYCYRHSRDISVKDVIYRGGLFISTCSIVYRREVAENRPDYWLKCRVGDYPLQIACVLKGKAWYFNELMSVYRVDNPSSWMGSQNWSKGGGDPSRMKVIQSQINMFYGFGQDYPCYIHMFEQKIADHINRNLPSRNESKEMVKDYIGAFSEYIKKYSFKWRLDMFMRQIRIPFFRGFYQIVFTHDFRAKNHYYLF